MTHLRFALSAVLLLTGCASGPHYWTKPGATAEMFKADHEECVRGATIGYGVGSERASGETYADELVRHLFAYGDA